MLLLSRQINSEVNIMRLYTHQLTREILVDGCLFSEFVGDYIVAEFLPILA